MYDNNNNMLTSTGIQSHIDCLSSVVSTVDCCGLNVTAIDTRCIPANHFKIFSWTLGTIFRDFQEFSGMMAQLWS